MTDLEDSDDDETFVVCPGTDLVPEEITSGGEVFTDIWFYQSGIRLLCGNDGQSRNMCKFKGGLSHLYVPDDDIEDIYVSGFSFEGATETSLMTYGTSISTATFVDCHWDDNSGEEGGAVNIWHTYDARGQAQKVTFEKCSFTNNKADDGAILVEGGKITMRECQVSNNEGGWAVELQLDSTAEIYDTCFTNNPGPVYIYKGSQVAVSENNHGRNNNGDEYNCEGSWDDTGDSCQVFTASECQAGGRTDSSSIKVSFNSVFVSFSITALISLLV